MASRHNVDWLGGKPIRKPPCVMQRAIRTHLRNHFSPNYRSCPATCAAHCELHCNRSAWHIPQCPLHRTFGNLDNLIRRGLDLCPHEIETPWHRPHPYPTYPRCKAGFKDRRNHHTCVNDALGRFAYSLVCPSGASLEEDSACERNVVDVIRRSSQDDFLHIYRLCIMTSLHLANAWGWVDKGLNRTGARCSNC
jgi:hypothetical protein